MALSRPHAALLAVVVVILAASHPTAAADPAIRAPRGLTVAPGIRGSWSQKGVDYAREVAIALMEGSFSSFTLPDISFDKDSFSGHVTNFKCDDLKIASSESTLEANKGVLLGVSGLALQCTANWNYRENIWPHIPHGSGSVDASSDSSGLSAVIGVIDAGGKPNVHAASCTANVNIANLDFHGGLSGDILNLFKHLIADHIESSMNTLLCQKLTSIVDDKFNQVLDGFSLTVPLDLPGAFNISSAEFGLSDNPVVTSEYIGIDLIGEVVNRAHPTAPPFAPPALPAFAPEDADHMLQIYLSQFVFNSGAWVFQQAGLIDFVITPSMVPAASPVKLNTSDFTVLAPGLAKMYPNMGLDLKFETSAAPMLHGYVGGVNLTAGVTLTFAPVTKTGPQFGFELNCTFAGDFEGSINTTKPERLVGKVGFVSCPLHIVRTAVGPVQVKLIQSLVNFIFSGLVLPKVNTILAHGFPLPTFKDVQMVDSELYFGEGYLKVATDIKFVGPGESEAEQQDGPGWSAL